MEWARGRGQKEGRLGSEGDGKLRALLYTNKAITIRIVSSTSHCKRIMRLRMSGRDGWLQPVMNFHNNYAMY
eukprot:scaffold243985_cov18-Prasinocladus_malaysianus.AAC.1